jgi:protein-L-isoaspartate(D-aspartate) O-methyltransferase
MHYFIIVFFIMAGCKGQNTKNNQETDDFKSHRLSMIETQIVSRGVKDEKTLNAMRDVPRHEFVPDNLRKMAYLDEPLPIGEDQTISQPYIVAYMTEQLALKPNDRVLEIGTGSGYQAAILAEIVDSVFTIEIVDVLAKRAEKTLKSQGYKNIFVQSGDGYAGWPEHAPFDKIIITAAPPRIPQPLVDQLKIGGRMIVPLGKIFQELILITKSESGIQKEKLLPVRFVPMTGEIQD